MADTSSAAAPFSATFEPTPLPQKPPSMRPGPPEPPDAIAITRHLQAAVLRLRWVIIALKSAAAAEHENPHDEPLFWPDLMDVLKELTPDADMLDFVVDELRCLQPA